MRGIFFLFFCITLSVFSQNHLPNPGFENHQEGFVSHWKQPSPPYYHFEIENNESGKPKSGERFNGLCIANFDRGPEINEKMLVQLITPLKAGQTYCLKIHVRQVILPQDKNPDFFNELQWYFFEDPQDQAAISTGDTNIQVLRFILPEGGDQSAWTLLEQNYVAKGNEKYLSMGYFKDFEREQKALQPPPMEVSTNKRKKKKQEDDFKAFREQIRLMNAAVADFRTRVYFDDLCIAPLYDGTCDCSKLLPDEDERDSLKADLISIDKAPEVGAIIKIENIFFETAKANLLPISYERLNHLHKLLVNQPKMRVQINGHTDNQGAAEMNQDLSEMRAKAVVDYLIGKGIDAARLNAKGFGATKPVADNETEIGREKNRRVTFEVLSNE